MNSIKSWINLTVLLCFPFFLCAQEQEKGMQSTEAADITAAEAMKEVSFADPLIPQLFAFDKDNGIFAGINKVNNAVDIIIYSGSNLSLHSRFEVDIYEGRHDEFRIYRPQSVAIYDGHIVILATQRDSCYLSVQNIKGEELDRFYFPGNAFAFSYSPESKELYIAGENDLGYDIAILNIANGFDNIIVNQDLNYHYVKPKKSEQMAERDPYGVSLTIIALIVVFFSLVLLFVCFKALGKGIVSFNRRRAIKQEIAKTGGDKEEVKTKLSGSGEVGGEAYAAIAAAIYMYQSELHDEENTTITIEKVSRNYSPWNSKIYGMNTYFQNKSK